MTRLKSPRAFLDDYLGGEAATPILTLALLNTVDEFDRAALAVLGPDIGHRFGIGVGVFTTIVVVARLVEPFISLPVSILADRSRRLPLALTGAAIWGVASFGTGLATTLTMLVVFRGLSAFGKVVNEPVHGSLIADYYSNEHRAKAYGIHSLADPVGQVLASITAGVLAEAWGYTSVFRLLALPTIIAFMLGLRLREPERGNHEIVEVKPSELSYGEMFRRLWAIRSMRYQWIGFAFISGTLLGTGAIVAFYLEEEFGVGAKGRGFIWGIGQGLGAMAVVFGTAWIQRRVNAAGPRAALRTLAQAGVVSGSAMFLLAFAPSLWLAVACIYVALIVIGFTVPGLKAMTATVAPPELRTTAFAMASLMALAGAGFAILGAALGEAGNTRVAFGVLAPIFLQGVAYFFKASNYIEDDVDRLRPPDERRPRDTMVHGDALLEVSNLCVSYGAVQVLFGIDLDVGAGEMVALLGTNGSGKSTTLNGISGVVEPDRGNVWLDGEPLTGLAPDRIVRKGVVQAPGGKGIFPGLTVAENLQMGAFLLGRDQRTADSRIGEVVELFPRIGERLTQRAGDLSGGERQMLTLGQSFLLRPKILMIDELSLGLAPTIVQELLEAVRNMNAAGTTMLVVEQSVNVALTLAHRAYFLEKGEVRFSGPTRDLLDRPDLLRSVFLEGAATTTT